MTSTAMLLGTVRRLGGTQRTFQSLEVVGRWGDAEFVVGMYGMSKDDGLAGWW